MATAIAPFRLLQLGKETTKGTLVAATVQVPGDWSFTEEQGFYRPTYPRGRRLTVGGAGVITNKGMTVEVEGDLTAEDILWPLHLGVIGGISPTGAGNAKTWTFTPESTTYPTLDSATIELVESDGSTNHYYGEAGYGLCASFGISAAFNQVAKYRARYFARARQTGTVTASLTPYSSREELVSNLCFVYADTSWANLGTTQLTAIVRSLEFECVTGVEPDFTLDGRSDLDMTKHKVAGTLRATLNLVLEFDTNALAQSFTKFRSNSLTYIRVKFTGNAIAGGGNKTVQIDGAYRFVGPPQMSGDGDVRLVTAQLESVFDSTGGKALEFVAINTLTSL